MGKGAIKFTFTIALLFILIGNLYPQQDLEKKYLELKGYKLRNFWQLTLQGGFFIPMGYLNDNYFSSGSAGFDVSYRINKEVALYAEFRYDILSPRDTLGPSSGYFKGTVGSRLYIRPPCYRSAFFFEAAIGTYIFNQGSAVTPTKIYASDTKVRFGANTGIGGEIVLTNALFLTVKGKINSVFTSQGSNTFVSGIGGLTIRF